MKATKTAAAPKASANAFAAFVTSAPAIQKAVAPIVATPKQAAATKAKATAKPAVKVTPAKGAINYIVRGDRATKLFAHTAAWLELSGMMDGGSYPSALVRELGGSALNYHIKQGNFSESQGMASLTQKGLDKFAARALGQGHGSYANEDKEHYMLMMMEGLNDARLVKNEGAIRKIAD